MLFVKKHSLVFDRPINVLRNDLKSFTKKVKITELNETKFHGLMKNKYGSGYHIHSKISLTSNSPYKTSVEIINEFDFFTNMTLILMFIVLWGISIFKIVNGQNIMSFEIILMLTFPIIGALITMFSFKIFDNRIMKIYRSLIGNTYD